MPKKRLSPPKRNPNDATFRNINALKKRVDALESDVRDLLDLVIPLRHAPEPMPAHEPPAPPGPSAE